MNIPLNIDWQQILLHMFNFVILFAVLYFVLYKPVKAFMDKRADLYKDMDDKAKERLAEAEQIKKEYSEKLADVESEILLKQKEAGDELSKMKNEAISNAEKEAKNIIAGAKASADKEYDEIIKRANNEILDMVSSAAEKLVFSDTSEAYESFLGSVEGSDSNDRK